MRNDTTLSGFVGYREGPRQEATRRLGLQKRELAGLAPRPTGDFDGQPHHAPSGSLAATRPSTR